MRVILVGGGEVVFFLARSFLSKGYKVTVINHHRHECEQLAKSLKALVISGDGTDPKYLEAGGAREAQMLISVTPYDHINLVCCQTGNLMFKIPRTLALVNDPDNYQIFKDLGIDEVFNQTGLIVKILEKSADYKNVEHMLTYADGRAMIFEVTVSEGMPAAGKTVDDIKIEKDMVITGIYRGDTFLFPDDEMEIQNHDRLLILATPESYPPIVRSLCGDQA